MNIYPMHSLPPPALDEVYRNYRIVSYIQNNTFIGEVYKDNSKIETCEADSTELILQHTRLMVDRLIKRKIHVRQNAIPSQKEIVIALNFISANLSTAQNAILRYQLTQNNKPVAVNSLQKIAQCATTTDIYFILADIARKLCDELAYEPPMPLECRDPFIALIVAPEINYTKTNGSITLKLQPLFFNALRSIVWLP